MNKEVVIDDPVTGELVVSLTIVGRETKYPFGFMFEGGDAWVSSDEAYEIYKFLEEHFGPKSIENE